MSCLLAWAAALLLLPLIILAWLAESRGQRIRRWRRSGLTWAACATRLGVSPSTARRWAAS
jgi:hypothetical protein